MTTKNIRRNDNPEKRTQQEANLGQKQARLEKEQARLEKEKESELSRMGETSRRSEPNSKDRAIRIRPVPGADRRIAQVLSFSGTWLHVLRVTVDLSV